MDSLCIPIYQWSRIAFILGLALGRLQQIKEAINKNMKSVLDRSALDLLQQSPIKTIKNTDPIGIFAFS